MAGNNLLTSSIIVKRALAKLVDESQVLAMVNRDYQGQYDNAKAGDTINVRVPQHAAIRKGRIMDEMAVSNVTVPITINNYYGVDTGATSAELAMQIDDFAEQFIDPFIPDLLINVESDFINQVTNQVPATVGAYGAFNSQTIALQAKAYMDAQLAPKNDRNLLVNTYSQIDIVQALSALFNSQTKIDKQYRSGRMAADTLGSDWYQSNLTASVTRGTGAGYLVNGAAQSGSSLIVGTGTGTINVGDTFTIAGVFDVHSQTKVAQPILKQFTVTTAYAGGAGTLAISPAITLTGTEQNVSAAPASGAAITIKGTSGTDYVQNLLFSQDAFYFVTANLPNPGKNLGVDSATASYKGIKLRFIRDFDIVNDKWRSRFDIVWGGGILRPELAVRIPATITAF